MEVGKRQTGCRPASWKLVFSDLRTPMNSLVSGLCPWMWMAGMNRAEHCCCWVKEKGKSSFFPCFFLLLTPAPCTPLDYIVYSSLRDRWAVLWLDTLTFHGSWPLILMPVAEETWDSGKVPLSENQPPREIQFLLLRGRCSEGLSPSQLWFLSHYYLTLILLAAQHVFQS